MIRVGSEKLKQQLRDDPALLDALYDKYASSINSMDKVYEISQEEDKLNKISDIIIDRGYLVTKQEKKKAFMNVMIGKAWRYLLFKKPEDNIDEEIKRSHKETTKKQ